MRVLRAIAIAAAAAGCGDDSSSAVDAAQANQDGSAMSADAAPPRDGAAPLSWVSFSITGCLTPDKAGPPGSADAGVPAPCTARAPAELEFTAVAPSRVDNYLWSFGDGTGDSTEASPRHTYRLPGTYDVTLSVGGPGGTATTMRVSAVEVRPVALGGSCQEAAQCSEGSCLCGEQDACPAGLAAGMCVSECALGTPCDVGVCANLAPSAPTKPAPWQATVCVPTCADTSQCPSGLACRELSRGDAGGWVRGCFPPTVMGDIGDSCLDATDRPDDAACTSGTCIAEGARGMCAQVCTTGTCPDSSACASFGGNLGSLCVKRCTSAADCGDDPWLACQMPGATGTKSFTVDETPAPNGYCAPKACTDMPGECGIDGACVDGYCAASN